MKLIKHILTFILIMTSSFPCFSQDDSFKIERGDVLSIEVMEHPEFNRTGIIVLPDGFIQYPAIGSLKVAGYSSSQLADSITSVLDNDYVINPIVTVYINRIYDQSVNIFGAVNNPGRIQIYEPIEVMKALGMAGGIKDIKHVTKVIIIRKDGSVEEINLKKILKKKKIEINNLALIYPEDTVIIKEKRFEWSKLSFFATMSLAVIRVIEILI